MRYEIDKGTFIEGSFTEEDIKNGKLKKLKKSFKSELDYSLGKAISNLSESITISAIELSSKITRIKDFAFMGCVDLKRISISSSVTEIADKIFYDCKGLETIIVDKDNPVYDSRYNCNAIIETSTNTLISGCKNTVIPNSVTGIGNYAFEFSAIKCITIPSNIIRIGEEIFANCSDLEAINVDPNNLVYDSRNNCNAVIETASNMIIAGCKNTVIPDGVTDIGDCAFLECSGLKKINIPSTVTNIGACSFQNCIDLISVTIPESVIEIEEYAFRGCKELRNIVIPSSITSISISAYERCTSLKSVVIPSSVTDIGEDVFCGCSSLESIVVDKDNPVYDSRDNCNALIETATNTLLNGCMNTIIPESVTRIGEYAFWECTGLTNITIPNNVTYIGDSAFDYCTNLKNIIFDGTKKQWKELVRGKDLGLNNNCKIYTN